MLAGPRRHAAGTARAASSRPVRPTTRTRWCCSCSRPAATTCRSRRRRAPRELLAKGLPAAGRFSSAKRGGFEWFGKDPGHEALTAYGLLQFHDMSRVFAVDQPMVARTRDWLLGPPQRQGRLRARRHRPPFVRRPFAGADQCLLHLRAAAIGHEGETSCAPNSMRWSHAAPATMPMSSSLIALRAAARRTQGSHRRAPAPRRTAARRRLAAGHHDVDHLQRRPRPDRRDHRLRGARVAARSGARRPRSSGARVPAEHAFGAGHVRRQPGHRLRAARAIAAYVQSTRAQRTAGTLRVLAGERVLAEQPFTADATEPVVLELWEQAAARRAGTAPRGAAEGRGGPATRRRCRGPSTSPTTPSSRPTIRMVRVW